MISTNTEDDHNPWPNRFREWRHNPCIMRPTSALVMFVILLFWMISLALRFPTFLLGMVMGPVFARSQWAIEFIYPMDMMRWAHLYVIRLLQRTRKSKPDDINKGFHSRAMETRIEVLKDRVYIHPLPQFMDNLGYLVVCLPPRRVSEASENETEASQDNADVSQYNNARESIVAFVVDCGDANTVSLQVSMISELHYSKQKIEIHCILSTHKHHDHTAGNGALQQDIKYGKSIKLVFGGAVEAVPHCNYPLANGDMLPLPKCGPNDMNDAIEVEAIATPAHTRGSITYALRPVSGHVSSGAAFLFTGDTMFSGGGGVPFEADIDVNQESKSRRMTANTFIKASAAAYAVERCFAEIMFRSVKQDMMQRVSSEQLLIFPGHEYTNELLSRQLPGQETNRWKNASPAIFFETMSQYYVTVHRRSLPQTSGKLLCAPSSIRTEVMINPNLRSLKVRGESVINALKLWNRNWAVNKAPEDTIGAFGVNDSRRGTSEMRKTIEKTQSSATQWNLDCNTLNKQVFTTVYSAELDSIIDDLRSGKIDSSVAATRLCDLKTNLHTNIVLRRPIPGTLPSDKNIYKGLVGFALLGSSPSGLTLGDSEKMKLHPPITTSSDCILVSKRRLVSVLYLLGLLDEERTGNLTVSIIQNLWKEAFTYTKTSSKYEDFEPEKNSSESSAELIRKSSPTHTDMESCLGTEFDDEVTLGALKWVVYGIPVQKQSLRQFCLPCSKVEVAETPSPDHPAGKSNWKIHTGELVRHDIRSCKLSQSATGYEILDENRRDQAEAISGEHCPPNLPDYGSTESEDYVENESIFEDTSVDVGNIVRDI